MNKLKTKKQIQVANVTLLFNDSVLVLKRSERLRNPGLYGLPGGLVDANERPRDAALRELHEETGIKAEDVLIITTDKYVFDDGDEEVNITNLTATIEKKPIIKLDPHEHSEFMWLKLKDIDYADNLLPGLKTMIKNSINVV